MQDSKLNPAKRMATARLTSPTITPTQNPSTTATPATLPAKPVIDTELLEVADDIGASIRQCMGHSLGWLIMTGVRLREFRDELPKVEWAQILRSGRLPVGARLTQMLIRIARNKVLTDSKHWPKLPDSLTILNSLAGLPATVLEQALDSGVLHRNTTLKEAQKFMQEWLAKPSTSAKPKPQISLL
jgi:hypothetical protein